MPDSTDPLRDLERRIDRLAARIDLSDAQIRADLAAIRADIARLHVDADDHITRAEFSPVRQLTFGAAALILVAVLTALVAQVVR
jgi:hypothetical protein